MQLEPLQKPHPPIWVGGASDGALRRVARHADAWHPVRGRVRWLRDAAAMAEASVFALSSRFEGFGMVLVEAGLAGCDLVGSDLGGIRDMVGHGKTGRVVPPNDPGALAEVLTDCLARPEAALKRGAAARQKALEYLSRRKREMNDFQERFSSLVA